MPGQSLPFRLSRSWGSQARPSSTNRLESLEARRLLSSAIDSVLPVEAEIFQSILQPIVQPILVEIAAPIIAVPDGGVVEATPIIAIPDNSFVEVTSPGEAVQPVELGPIITVPPVVTEPDQYDDNSNNNKGDKKDKADKKQKKDKDDGALAEVEVPTGAPITIDPVDEPSFGGGGGQPIDLPPLSGGTDLGAGEGSIGDLPIIEIPDTEVPTIELPIVAIPIVAVPITEVPPTVTPPIVTPPNDEPPPVTPPTDEPPTVTPPTDAPPKDEPVVDEPVVEVPVIDEPVVEVPTDDGNDPVAELPTRDPDNSGKPGDNKGTGNNVDVTPVVQNPPTNNLVDRDRGNDNSGSRPAPSQPQADEPSAANDGESIPDTADADAFADRAAAAASVFSSTPVTDDAPASDADAETVAAEAAIDSIEAVPAEEVSAVTEEGQSSDAADESKYGRVGAGGASEEARNVVRRFSVRVQTLAELAVADPEEAQLAAATFTEQPVSVVIEEAGQVEEVAHPAAMASFSPASPTTTANVHNIMAAVLAGATFVTIYWNRWRKRKLEESAAAASKLAGLLRFDPLAVWLDDRSRFRR